MTSMLLGTDGTTEDAGPRRSHLTSRVDATLRVGGKVGTAEEGASVLHTLEGVADVIARAMKATRKGNPAAVQAVTGLLAMALDLANAAVDDPESANATVAVVTAAAQQEQIAGILTILGALSEFGPGASPVEEFGFGTFGYGQQPDPYRYQTSPYGG